MSADSVIRAMPPLSETRRRIRSCKSSDQLDKSMPRSMDAMSSVQRVFVSVSLRQRLAEHGYQAVQRLGGDFLVLNERDADIALAGIAGVGAVAREIVTGNDAQAAVAPKVPGDRLITALPAHVEPEEEAAGRTLIAITVADDLIGKVEFRDVERAVVLDMGLVAVGRDGDLLRRHRHLRRRDVAQLDVAGEEPA